MEKEYTWVRFGKRVRVLRELRGWSQTQLAEAAGITRTHVGRIEKGRYGTKIETLQAVAEALGMTVDIIDRKLQDLTPLKVLQP